MSRAEIKVEINLLDQGSPDMLHIKVIDRGILNEEDVDYILSCLPPVSMARVDADSYKPFLGIDMFYDEGASLKGVVFVFKSRALAIRVPANIAKTTAKAYEEENIASRRASNKSTIKLKGRSKNAPTNTPLSSLECLRKLLRSDLAGFGMAQISLTLWHYLHEKISGVNLSTAISEPTPPPKRALPEPKNEDGSRTNPEARNDKRADTPGGKGNKGGARKGRGARGGAANGRKGSQQEKSSDNLVDKNNSEATLPVILPDDEPLNWDRKILSPGDVVKKIYPNASRMDVDSAFIGNNEVMDLQGRIAEAATRAWISSIVADKLNAEVQNAPVVKSSRLRDKELTFFADSMVAKWKVLGETAPLRTLQLDQFEDDDGLLKSNKYETKLRAGQVARQYLSYIQDGVEKRLFLHRPGGMKPRHTHLTEEEDFEPEPPNRQKFDAGERGSAPRRSRGSRQQRRGQVRDYGDETSEFQGTSPSATTPAPKRPPLKLPKDVEISIYGREEATRSDEQRDMFILRLLEGRGSLHGPKYKDCAFIRRVWFPTQAQLRIGEERKAKNSKATRGRHDWIDDDWGDDTDEDEVARIQALALEEGDEDAGDETEGEDAGKEDPTRGVSLPKKLNSSQQAVVARVVAPNPRRRTRATLVHGPPGTGKTSTIAAAVIILAEVGEPAWIVAQSNVGIKNVAVALQKAGFNDLHY